MHCMPSYQTSACLCRHFLLGTHLLWENSVQQLLANVLNPTALQLAWPMMRHTADMTAWPHNAVVAMMLT